MAMVKRSAGSKRSASVVSRPTAETILPEPIHFVGGRQTRSKQMGGLIIEVWLVRGFRQGTTGFRTVLAKTADRRGDGQRFVGQTTAAKRSTATSACTSLGSSKANNDADRGLPALQKKPRPRTT